MSSVYVTLFAHFCAINVLLYTECIVGTVDGKINVNGEREGPVVYCIVIGQGHLKGGHTRRKIRREPLASSLQTNSGFVFTLCSYNKALTIQP